MKLFITTVVALAAIGMGSAAMAQSTGDAMHGDAMHSDAMHAMKPMMICRPAESSDTPSGKLADGTAIVCKKLDTAMIMKGPNTPDSTPARMEDKAWLKQLETYMYVGN